MPVESYPLDQSPYGVRGMAGNAVDWCCDAYAEDILGLRGDGLFVRPETPGLKDEVKLRAMRGGFWFGFKGLSRMAYRVGHEPDDRDSSVGFRLARTFKVGGS